ncbi:MAG: hypothetical protein ABI520_06490 [Caldimonas sp.]
MTNEILVAGSPRLRPDFHPFRRYLGAAAVIGLSVMASAMQPSVAHEHGSPSSPAGSSPLVEKVRDATARYKDINIALGEGWVQATPCVSGPNDGAMGVHFLMPDRLHDGMLRAEEPEMLIYEPGPAGTFRLVGVEYLVLVSEWAARNGPGVAASVDGHLAHLIPEPNRYALPALYELHVWAWENNPNGTHADWNSRVSCDRQRAPQ